MFFYCVCCVLSGRGLCDELITRPEESYRLWCVVVCASCLEFQENKHSCYNPLNAIGDPNLNNKKI